MKQKKNMFLFEHDAISTQFSMYRYVSKKESHNTFINIKINILYSLDLLFFYIICIDGYRNLF